MYLFKQWKVLIAICLLTISTGFVLRSQDTIPPIFVKAPSNDSVSCLTINPKVRLQSWYNNHAGATAVDSSGLVMIKANITLIRANAIFDSLVLLPCAKNRNIRLGFYAEDLAGNLSDTLYALFKIDNSGPNIIKQADPNVQRSCAMGIKDSLVSWIKKSGNAIASEGCGGKIRWQNFIYTTNAGVQGSGDIANGPYPEIPSNACNWVMDVSFIVTDSCGNNKAVTGRFRIRDDVPPVLGKPSDLTVNCSTIPDSSIAVVDYCDKSPTVFFTETSDQNPDTTNCGHYTYVLRRTWIAVDKCGNADTSKQRILVLDNTAPDIRNVVDITISCTDPEISIPRNVIVLDECKNLPFAFSDSIVGISGCETKIRRTFSSIDFCGNKATKQQSILIRDDQMPSITQKAQDLVLLNPDTAMIRSRYETWVNEKAGLIAQDNCSGFDVFILRSGSYNVQNIKSLPALSTKYENFPSCFGIDTFIHLTFDVIVRDSCGNFLIDTAVFTVIDNVAPTFTNCSKDTLIVFQECEANVIAPLVLDMTSTVSSYKAIIGSDTILTKPGDTINFRANKFLSQIIFEALDCAGNISTCVIPIKSLDSINLSYAYGACESDSVNLFSGLDPKMFGGQPPILTWLKNGDTIGTGYKLVYAGENIAGDYSLVVKLGDCTIMKAISVEGKDLYKPLLQIEKKDYCLGQAIILNTTSLDGVVRYLWYQQKGNELKVDTTLLPSIQLVVQDSVLYTLRIEQDGCLTNFSDTILVFPVMVVKPQIMDSIQYCKGEHPMISVLMPQQGYSYQWVYNGKTFAEGQTISIPDSIASTSKGLISVSSTYKSCTSEPSSFYFNIISLDSFNISGGTSFCQGSNLNLSIGIQADSIQWYFDDKYLITSERLLIDSLSNQNTGNYSAIAFLNACSIRSKNDHRVDVSGSLEVKVSLDRPLSCEGDSIRLSVNGIENASYQWTGPDGLSGANPSISFAAKSGLYGVTVIKDGSCTGTKDTFLRINVRPVLDKIETNFDPCLPIAQDSFRLTAIVRPDTGSFSYNWFGPLNFRSTMKTPTIIVNSDGVFGRYRLEVRNGNCISEIKDLFISKNRVITKPNFEMGAFYCDGDQIKMTSRDTFTKYIWHTPDTILITSAKELVLVEPIKEGLYFLEASTGSCPKLYSDTVDLKKISRPGIPTIIGPDSICYGDSLHLMLGSLVEDSKFVWTLPTGASITTSGGLNIIDIPDKITGSYSVRALRGFCSSETSMPIRVGVKPAIEAPKFDRNDLEICDTGNVPIDFCFRNLPQERNLKFSVSTFPDRTIVYENVDTCVTLNTASLVDHFTRLRLRSKRGECYSDTFDDLFIDKADRPNVLGDITSDLGLQICDRNDTIRVFNFDRPDSIQFFWRILEEEVILKNEDGNVIKLYNFESDTIHVLLSMSYDVCRDFARDTALIIVAGKEVVKSDTIFLEGDQQGIDQLIYLPERIDASKFDFFFESSSDYSIVKQTSGSGFEVSLDKDENEYLIPIEVCSKRCIDVCEDTHLYIYREMSDISCKVPNVITPNGDGVNDVLTIDCIEDLSWHQLTIFTPTGDKVFESDQYVNEWDAKYKGENLPSGTYYYILEGDLMKGKTLSGFIMVQR